MYNIENYQFGTKLRKARKAKKMSIEELARKIGKSVPSVYKYESNEVIVDLQTALEICNALGVDIESFVEKKQ